MKTAFGFLGAAALMAAATSYAQDPASTEPLDTTAPVDTVEPTENAATAESPAAYSEETASSSSSTTMENTELAAPSYLGIMGIYTDPDSDRSAFGADIDRGVGIDLLYGWQSDKRWGYEVHGWYQTFETGDSLRTDHYHYGLGVDLFYAFGDRTHFTPFVLIGGGATYNDIYPNGAEDDGFSGFLNGGVGFVTGPFTKVGNLRLRGDVRYVYDFFADKYGDIRYALGIEIPLFKEKLVTVAAATDTTKIVEVPTGLTDSDGDGIVDDKDKCPDTPAGSRVDGDGCPFDKVINLKGVTFEFNKTRLRPDAQTILEWATGVLQKYPDMNVEIAGHTDSIGGDSYNQKLSEGRAQSVKEYFIGHGIPETQLSAKGYGEAQPIADNNTEEGRERNRRVELRILN